MRVRSGEIAEYKCGYKGKVYGSATSEGVSAPWCPKCQRNNNLKPVGNSK